MTTFNFPTNGNALTAIKSSVLDTDSSLPPPRKAPKIEASSSVHTPRYPDRKRTFRIVTNTCTYFHIHYCAPHPNLALIAIDPIRPVLQTIRQRVELSIREILRVDDKILISSPTTTYSFESIFDDCRSTIILGHTGKHLTGVFETALNKAAQDVLAILKKNDSCSAEWLAACLGAWDWWLYRLVCYLRKPDASASHRDDFTDHPQVCLSVPRYRIFITKWGSIDLVGPACNSED